VPGVRITVPKREYYRDLPDEHLQPDAPERRVKRHSVFEDGQMFDTGTPCRKPLGFCDRAWRDTRRNAQLPRAIARKNDGRAQDGMKSVSVRVDTVVVAERVEEEGADA